MTLTEAYQILGVKPGCSFEEVKTAYRKLLYIVHPDRGGRASDFIKVRAAYEILCHYYGKADQTKENDIPIPEDLKKIINEMVRDFTELKNQSNEIFESSFQSFRSYLRHIIQNVERSELKNFGKDFNKYWNEYITELFTELNERNTNLTKKYEQWLGYSLEDIFQEKLNYEMEHYLQRPQFYFQMVLFAGLGFLLSYLVFDFTTFLGLSLTILISSVSAYLSKPFWDRQCKHKIQQSEMLDILKVSLFKKTNYPTFEGTQSIFDDGKNLKNNYGWVGFAAGGIFSGLQGNRAMPGAWIGALVGYSIGEVAERIKFPTEQIRQSLDKEVSLLLDHNFTMIESRIHDAFTHELDNLSDDVKRHYESQIKKIVHLLTQ